MFWKFNLHTSSHLEALLDRDDVTLAELMEEEDVLQECKAQNRRLLLFLSQDSCMQELIRLITTEPPAGEEETRRFKYPNIACELLTCDVGVINDKLGDEEPLLEALYSFLEQPPPLNPLLASFFSKTIGNLITRKTEQVIWFLRGKEGFLPRVLKHIDASAMMDLLLRLISCVEPAPLRQDTLNWLNDERLAQRLVELIRPGTDDERQSNASQTICDIIRLSRDQANQLQENSIPDPLLIVLESQECVGQLLKNMFEGPPSDSCIVNGTQVLLTLLETRRPVVESVMDVCTQGCDRCSILLAILPHLTHFHQLLLHPPKRSPMLTSLGVLEEPLGNDRLQAARLAACLLQTCCQPNPNPAPSNPNPAPSNPNPASSNPNPCPNPAQTNPNTNPAHSAILHELARLNTMDLLLDLFFKYTWNNFLHFQVELCVAGILCHSAQEGRAQPCLATQERPRLAQEPQQEQAAPPKSAGPPAALDTSSNNTLVAHLFQHCRLVQRILAAWEENDKIQAGGGMRRGYMGHLTRIANTVVQSLEKGPAQTQNHISNLLTVLPEDCRGRWDSFVDQTLTETNRKNTVDLVSTDDDLESPFPNEMSLQQAFSDYQIQQMTANFVDQFGFNDEEFAEHDDNINATFDRIAEINISIKTEKAENTATTTAFEACSKEKIQPFDDEEDIWEEKEMNYAMMQSKSRNRFGGPPRTLRDSSQSSRRSVSPDRSMGSDTNAPNKTTGSDTEEGEVPKEALEQSKTKMEADPFQSAGWADFGEVNSKAPAPGAGIAAWDSVAPQPVTTETEEKGWAKFTDFQPFCCSETGPRCSSPVDSEISQSDRTKPSQDRNSCVWSVCVARKAPLVASDSSSSGGSDSEEEEEKTESISMETVTMETVTMSAGKESIRHNMDAKQERAVFTSESPEVSSGGLSLRDGVRDRKEKEEKPLANPTSPPPSGQPAAVTTETPTSANGPA